MRRHTFQEGQVYEHARVTDRNLVTRYEIIKRTPKRLSWRDQFGSTGTCAVQFDPAHKEDEFCYPEGRFSMCPVLTAKAPEPQLTIDEILEDGLDLDDLGAIQELAEDAKEDIEEVVNLVSSLPKTKTELRALKKNELVALAEEHGLDVQGTKADLVARLATLL